MSSAAAASIRAFGVDRGLPFPVEDIAGAETILLVGSNAAETMPPIMQYFDKSQSSGGSLIVADPRASLTAQRANLHLQLTPGTDAALANGILHMLIEEGLIDEKYVRERTVGFDLVKAGAVSYWPGRVERITGVPEQQIVQAARILGNARSAMVLTARGPEQQGSGRKQHAVLHQHCSCPWPRRQAIQRLRLPYRAGQRTGRTGARPEI